MAGRLPSINSSSLRVRKMRLFFPEELASALIQPCRSANDGARCRSGRALTSVPFSSAT